MGKLWTWDGRYFGQRDGDDLYTHDGRHVGHFKGDEVYSLNGHYLGELRSGKLITNTSKLGLTTSISVHYISKVGHVPAVGHVGQVLPAGYKDFPEL